MPRFLSTVLVIALLGGTAAAFAVTQGLKNEPSPITAPRIAKVFSPTCDCATRAASIRFRLRKPDRVRVQIVDGSGDVVRTLVPGRRLRRGTVSYTWNGRDDAGRFVAQGVYKPRVHLADQHRTIDLPNEMRVDTTAPRVTVKSVAPAVISPDGDGRADRVMVRYALSERAHAILFVGARRLVFTRRQLPAGAVVWNGKVDRRPVRPGMYVLRLSAQDPAGNVSIPVRAGTVRVRYVELARPRIEAKARTRFGVRVSADARVQWRLSTRSGTAAPGLMVLHAPAKPGRYRLVVSVGDHSARASVIVSGR
ncbi:MAG: FlgD immunoglobulin-like domain containing protein [Verrucomicrobiota bacterium]